MEGQVWLGDATILDGLSKRLCLSGVEEGEASGVTDTCVHNKGGGVESTRWRMCVLHMKPLFSTGQHPDNPRSDSPGTRRQCQIQQWYGPQRPRCLPFHFPRSKSANAPAATPAHLRAKFFPTNRRGFFGRGQGTPNTTHHLKLSNYFR